MARRLVTRSVKFASGNTASSIGLRGHRLLSRTSTRLALPPNVADAAATVTGRTPSQCYSLGWPSRDTSTVRLARVVCSAAAGDAPTDKEFCVVNFYHLVDLEDPVGELERHRAFLKESGIDLRGRIYISPQGINAQYSGTREQAAGYAEWLAQQPGFADLSFTADPTPSGHSFPYLRLKNKPNLVSLSGGHAHLPVTDPAARATKLNPTEWKAMLEGGALDQVAKAVVLDVRNAYEWDAGHFQGAERPVEAEFRETPVESEMAHLEGVPKDAPVMMYCTGGIRCDIYSAALRARGYQNLYTLEGGIANYLRQQGGENLWDGSLFVFDSRNVLPGDLTGEQRRELKAAVPCQLCGAAEPVLPHLNCANIDCNKLFLACDSCKSGLKGCCCEACTNPPRMLRPLKEDGYYGRWTSYGGDNTDSQGAMASGRGEGRRRRRAAKKAAVRAETDAEKATRKALIRNAMAEMELQRAEEGGRVRNGAEA